MISEMWSRSLAACCIDSLRSCGRREGYHRRGAETQCGLRPQPKSRLTAETLTRGKALCVFRPLRLGAGLRVLSELCGKSFSPRRAQRSRRRQLRDPSPQVFEYRLERQVRFLCPLTECRQVFRILLQAQPHGVIDDLGNRSLSLGSLDSQSPVEQRIEINGRSFLQASHKGYIVQKRYTVKTLLATQEFQQLPLLNCLDSQGTGLVEL